MNPSQSVATLRPDLSGSLEEFDLAMDREGFIANRVAMPIEVASQAGTFGKLPIEELLRNAVTRRAPGAPYSRSSAKFLPATYATEEHGHEGVVDDREAKMYAEYVDAEAVEAMVAQDVVLRALELRVAAMLFNATTWTGAALTTGITNEWDKNHASDAVPIQDVQDAMFKVYDNSGLKPNALIINWKVFQRLRLLDQIQDAVASSGAGDSVLQNRISAQQIAQALGIDEVIVAGASQNTAKEGQNAVVAQAWSEEYAMVAKVAKTPNHKEPCVARIFHWGDDGSSIGAAMETYREEGVRGEIVRARMDTAEFVMYTQAAHLLSNVTT